MKHTHNIIAGISILILLSVNGAFASTDVYSLDKLMSQSIKNRESIRVLEGGVEKSNTGITIARSYFLPDLDVSYGATKDLDDYDESSSFRASSSLNLFSGFSNYHGLMAAKKSKEISLLQLKQSKQNLQLDVAAGFTRVFRSLETLKVAESSLKLFKERYEQVKLKFETGLLTRRDMLEVKVEADNAEQITLTADANVKKSLNQLSHITGIASLETSNLDFSVFDKLPVKRSYEPLEKELLAQRSELVIQKSNKEVYQRRYNAKKADYLPSVSLSADYSKYDESYEPWDDSESWSAGLSVSMNLFDGMATAAGLKSRKQDITNARFELAELENRLKTELKNTLLDFDVTEKNLAVADSGMDEAKEIIRTTELAFSNGRATTTDVLNSIYYLTRARQNVINARTDLILTDFRLTRMIEGFAN